LKLLQLKYPVHRPALTVTKTENWKSKYCEIAHDYSEELRKFDQNQGRIYAVEQLPFQIITAPTISEEERTKKLQQRKEQNAKLRTLAEQRRETQAKKQEKQLTDMINLQNSKHSKTTEKFLQALQNFGYNTEKELEKAIFHLKVHSKEGKNDCNLIDTPDGNLDDKQLEEKRKQKLLKKARENRVKSNKKRQELKEQQDLKKKQDEEFRQQNPELWIQDLVERKKSNN